MAWLTEGEIVLRLAFMFSTLSAFPITIWVWWNDLEKDQTLIEGKNENNKKAISGHFAIKRTVNPIRLRPPTPEFLAKVT